jgi:hypothetical protein
MLDFRIKCLNHPLSKGLLSIRFTFHSLGISQNIEEYFLTIKSKNYVGLVFILTE